MKGSAMKTDTLFYELFQTAPQTFFELLQITPPCPYRFESVTLKATEKRIDGILEPEQTGETIYFVEVQAFPDETIYWRTLREVSVYFEQRPALRENEWQAVILWLDAVDDPGFSTLTGLAQKPKPRLVSANLPVLLKQLEDKALSLNVLRPLVVANEQEVRQNILTWAENIQNIPDLSAEARQRLLSVLSQFIEQKFKTLTYKEISQMLNLTPLKETTSVQEILHENNVEMLIKQIRHKFHFAESTLTRLDARLRQLSLKDLETLFEDILDMQTLREINIWLDARLPDEAEAGLSSEAM
jgi:predicted transposase YdaD